MELNDVKAAASTALIESTDIAVLTRALEITGKMLEETWLNAENRRWITGADFQLRAKLLGESRGWLVGGQIEQREGISAFLGGEGALYAEASLVAYKFQTSAVAAALPGGVFFAFVFIKRTLGG